jgi:hypothetical protein
MTSRSYFATAGSSLLLLSFSSLSCMQKSPSGFDEVPARAAFGEDKARDEDKDSSSDSGALPDFPDPDLLDGGEAVDGDDDGGSAAPEGDDDDGGEEAKATVHADGCGDGEMQFEGKCTSKAVVKKILDKRDKAAVEEVFKAPKGAPKARAYGALLEHQVAQVEKTEDDLDEILEILREEKKKKDSAKEAP